MLSRLPQTNIVIGFLIYTLVGFLLLLLPVFHDQNISVVDTLFTAASAVSTTGLTTVSVADSFNWGGEFIIMCLFQLGGIGYMTLTTYFLLFTTSQIGDWHRKVLGAEFTIPSTIKIRDFIGSVIIFTLVMELLGAVALYFSFKDVGMNNGDAAWNGLFHSVSAFCTAGFNILPEGFESYKYNGPINTVLSILAICGSLGFIVVTDLYYRLRRKTKRLSFTTKIIFGGFVVLLSIGTLVNYFQEPTIYQDDNNPWLLSFFQTMSAMTTVGFNTVPIDAFSSSSLLFVVFLMYIGASPSGTAGGLKITTLFAMLSVLFSRLRGYSKISFLGKKIPFERLYVATSIFIMYTLFIFFGAYLTSMVEDFPFDKILFEASSAIGTVGLSAGLTSELSTAGKLIFSVFMFIGRVGVLTFGFSLLAKQSNVIGKVKTDLIEDDIAV